ncbi:hypothetical protein [Winogradskyella litoriviva]|uniref:hypothetical protein n=1 Tax=Winogradskyella litoriviva TaxID=1220182 RepID=UPI001564DA18|nr:hypothetical protein [Winogradskyella litoriviva]
MRKTIFLICLALVLNSCATIFNGKTTRVNIYAPENATVHYNKQTSIVYEGETSLYPKRSRDSLKFTITKDSISTDFAFKRKTSGLLYANLFTPQIFGAGFIIDFTNQRRFTYKRNIYLEIDSTTNTFKQFEGKKQPFKQHTTFIYTSPLHFMDFFSQPMVTLGVEYFPLDNFSISAEYGTMYIKSSKDNSKPNYSENKGFTSRYELKYYNLISITNNPKVNEYIALEARFLRHQFNKVISIRRINNDINYYIREPITVHKFLDIFNIKYGLNFPVGKRMYLDVYSGFGFRNKTFKNPNSFYNPETDYILESDSHLFFGRKRYLEGVDNQKLFNFSLGFKFGIKL